MTQAATKKMKITNGTKNVSKTPNLSPRISRKYKQPKFSTTSKIHKKQPWPTSDLFRILPIFLDMLDMTSILLLNRYYHT